ncbi:unnamed protein product [Paramecium sonneborni]|uniref:Uncharacterized protein n=1 Tax=Paramecium sonneborni TaxID=65129 RepID=A0A8S1P876_9CILI|nr:unnamed protein product [Paramecium sonneborni]
MIVDGYGNQAIEKFRENLKANIEGPLQEQIHFIVMKNQRQKKRVIEIRIQTLQQNNDGSK